MKKTLLILSALAFVLLNIACSDDDPSGTSVLKPENRVETPLDYWLMDNYVTPYNIEFSYRYEDMESDQIYNLIPAKYEKSIQMAKLVQHLCLQAYDEITGSRAFITSYFPKMIFLVGTPAYNNNNSVVLGTAEGGTKITLYAVNNMDPTDVDQLNDWYFKTIHHEFAHILNQTRPYSKDFEQITGQATGVRYVGDACFDIYPTDGQALEDGFISPYAATSADEEFVEISSIYVTNTAAAWEARLQAAGSFGRPLIEAKFEMVFKYMLEDWGIDLNQLRKVVLRRQREIVNLDLDAL